MFYEDLSDSFILEITSSNIKHAYFFGLNWFLSLDLEVEFDIILFVGLDSLVFAHFLASSFYVVNKCI